MGFLFLFISGLWMAAFLGLLVSGFLAGKWTEFFSFVGVSVAFVTACMVAAKYYFKRDDNEKVKNG